jgi:hypothetical protein
VQVAEVFVIDAVVRVEVYGVFVAEHCVFEELEFNLSIRPVVIEYIIFRTDAKRLIIVLNGFMVIPNINQTIGQIIPINLIIRFQPNRILKIIQRAIIIPPIQQTVPFVIVVRRVIRVIR